MSPESFPAGGPSDRGSAAPAPGAAPVLASDLPPVEVLTFGETMGSIRAVGPLRNGGAMNMSLAGAETNVAIGMARLGHTVRWVGRLGDDEVGTFALRTLRAESVLTDAVVRDPSRPTGLMLLEKRIADVSRAAYYRAGSAGSLVSQADLLAPLNAGPRILHVTGITPALSPTAADATAWAMAEAKSRGILISLDINYRAKLWDWDAAAAVLGPLADMADVLIASEDELALVAGEGLALGQGSPAAGEMAFEAALVSDLHARGVSDVVIKRGADGATGFSNGGTTHQGALKVPVLDTVGAGDAFTAGYLSGLLDGEPMPVRLNRGVTLGAFAVAGVGDWENLPDRSELGLLHAAAGSTIR